MWNANCLSIYGTFVNSSFDMNYENLDRFLKRAFISQKPSQTRECIFKILRHSFSSKLDWSSYIVPIATGTSQNPVLISAMRFFTHSFAWNTVVMSGQVLLAATWISWINCKSRYVGLLVLNLLLFVNLLLAIQM